MLLGGWTRQTILDWSCLLVCNCYSCNLYQQHGRCRVNNDIMSVIDSLFKIRYLQSKLSIGFRTRLTRYVHDLYLDNEKKTFYKALNLDGRIQGADQYVSSIILHGSILLISHSIVDSSLPILQSSATHWHHCTPISPNHYSTLSYSTIN